ncbi:MAG: 3-phosphoshikimate 1-carboxyvinyltransferase [Cytophagales bacterium]|nr:3-phosphoshikimate 1-carboxyvinyltransferase [Bernardetiaceae bacterium]MDW8205256.1 3-phosphoshikimate 1-carboxyvinyltransferase [Cytophagales bacterium]
MESAIFNRAAALALNHPNGKVKSVVALPASKSESNRALIIAALCNHPCRLENLSEARDTQTMQRLLSGSEEVLDVLDAGTTMRFLTAYCAVTNRKVVLTGTARMQERPIGILVDALREIGADISYEKNEGFPPVRIHGFSPRNNRVVMRGDVSSQYISALLMVAPIIPNGLTLQLTGKVGSRPYIAMTLQLMQRFGVEAQWEGDTIYVPQKPYTAATYAVESDWSAASYWFSIAALAKEANICLLGLKPDSLQGDRVIVNIMERLGVRAQFTAQGLQLSKAPAAECFEWDFSDCPDLAQTIAVVGAAKNIPMKLTGLESLRIKETDRLTALQTELAKFGIATQEEGGNTLYVHYQTKSLQAPAQPIHTYKDHRMAMAFAPLALLYPLQIEQPEVVEKSYPRYWEHLAAAGFAIQTCHLHESPK